MQLKKLFNVLVIGSATLTSGCGATGGNSGSGGGGGTATAGGGAAGGAAGGSAGGSSGGAGGGVAGGSAGGTAGGAVLNCPPDPAPPDAKCGCNCCWVTNCINTAQCCAAFSAQCTP